MGDILGSSMAWAILFLVAAAGISAFSARGMARQSARLAEEGVEIPAKVLAKDMRKRSMQLQPGQVVSGKVPVFIIGFQPAGGRERRVEVDVSKALFNRLDPGDSLPLRHLPNRPAIFEVEPGARRKTGRVGWFLAGAFLFAAAMLVVAILRGKG